MPGTIHSRWTSNSWYPSRGYCWPGPDSSFLRAPKTLRPEQIDLVLHLLRQKAVSYVTFESEDHPTHLHNYDTLLELEDEGAWTCRRIRGGSVIDDQAFPLAAA